MLLRCRSGSCQLAATICLRQLAVVAGRNCIGVGRELQCVPEEGTAEGCSLRGGRAEGEVTVIVIKSMPYMLVEHWVPLRVHSAWLSCSAAAEQQTSLGAHVRCDLTIPSQACFLAGSDILHLRDAGAR